MAVQRQTFRETGPFFVTILSRQKSIFMAYHTTKYAIYSSKNVFIWKNLVLSNKDKQKIATFADILDAKIFFTAVGENFINPKRPSLAKNGRKSTFFSKMVKDTWF